MVQQIWIYSLASILAVSFISLAGIAFLSIQADKLKKILIYMISFSAGALFGDAFLHLLPETIKGPASVPALILGGIILFFATEKVICWRHCHVPVSKTHVHSFAIMNLIGDGFHNFLDGLIIGASYLINIPTGIATTIAVAVHEIPQEVGDFGVLIHGGFSRAKALTLNFFSAVIAVLGGVVSLVLSSYIQNIQFIIAPIAIGGFIYIAGSDLIPELHRHEISGKIGNSLLQLLAFALGIAVMALLILLE